ARTPRARDNLIIRIGKSSYYRPDTATMGGAARRLASDKIPRILKERNSAVVLRLSPPYPGGEDGARRGPLGRRCVRYSTRCTRHTRDRDRIQRLAAHRLSKNSRPSMTGRSSHT